VKKIKRNHLSKSLLAISVIFFVVFSFTFCARKMAFQTSTVVPAAEGFVKVKKDDNNNYNIELNIQRLAESKRLTPPKELYIFWMESEDNGIKNLGRVNTSSGLFSSTLKSSLKTVTPLKPKRFFITAEDEERRNIQVRR
jgi:hypothetical protein